MVTDVLKSIIYEAEHQADLVVRFLSENGIKPRRTRAGSEIRIWEPAAAFLLNLGAAIRLREWEAAGLREHLPTLPDAAEALAASASAFCAGEAPNHPALDVFRTALTHLAHAGRGVLNTDLLLMAGAEARAVLVESLADFLWKYRHLGKRKLEAATDVGTS